MEHAEDNSELHTDIHLPQFFDRLTRMAVDLAANSAAAKAGEPGVHSNKLRTFVNHTHVLKMEAENPPCMRSPTVIRSSWEVVKNIGAEFRFFEEFRDQPKMKRELIEFLNSEPCPPGK